MSKMKGAGYLWAYNLAVDGIKVPVELEVWFLHWLPKFWYWFQNMKKNWTFLLCCWCSCSWRQIMSKKYTKSNEKCSRWKLLPTESHNVKMTKSLGLERPFVVLYGLIWSCMVSHCLFVVFYWKIWILLDLNRLFSRA